MTIITLILGMIIFSIIYFALKHYGIEKEQKKQVEERVAQLSQIEQKKRRLHSQMTHQGSFTDRAILPLALWLFQKIKIYLPLGGQLEWVQERLANAGYKKNSLAPTFLGVQFLCVIILGVIFFLESSLLAKGVGLPGIFFGIIGGVFGYLLPMIVLNGKVRARQALIQKSLPDFLELLVICVEAGMSLDSAILKIIQNQTPTPYTQPWRDELTRYLGDIEFGLNRKQAMLALGERTGVEDVKVFTNAINMAYEMGASVAQTLRVQCDTLRNKRLQRAEEAAQKIPVKMVPPIYIFLFPAIFVAIFGPLGMVLLQNIGGLMGK
ncbi:MAG: type II secretion system F family protein [Vampirovibrionales bacterium]